MLELIYGVPGSGKSYKAVNTIYDSFVDDKSKTFLKFKRVYTNINEFKHKAINDLHSNDVSFPLKMDDFKPILSQLMLRYKAGATDTELEELATTLNVFDALFVIDEAQNYFSKEDPVLLWWVEYHRHFHHDIILIAQSPRAIKDRYKDLSDNNFKAVPPSLRTSNSLKYKRYADPKLYKSTVTDTVSLSPSKRVFDLYRSGANENPKKVIYKFIAIAVVLAIVVVIGFIYFGSSFAGDKSTNDSFSNIKDTSPADTISISPSDTFSVACINNHCSCYGITFTFTELGRYTSQYSLVLVDTSVNDSVSIQTFQKSKPFFQEVLNVPFK